MTRTFGAASFRRVLPIGASTSRRVRGSKRTAVDFDETATSDGAACGSAASRKDMERAPLRCRARLTCVRLHLIVSADAHCQDRGSMSADPTLKSEFCNCLALRQAARHVTQFYDQFLAPAGLRT